MGEKSLKEIAKDISGLSKKLPVKERSVSFTVDTPEPITLTDKRVAELEAIVLNYKQDGQYALFFALNRKAGEISEALNSFTLSLISDDKSFERFNVLLKSMPQLTEVLDKLRSQYLKLSDVDVVELQKSGVPLIERQGVKNKKK